MGANGNIQTDPRRFVKRVGLAISAHHVIPSPLHLHDFTLKGDRDLLHLVYCALILRSSAHSVVLRL